MSIIPKLEELGFQCGLRWTYDGQRYYITPEAAAELPAPLVYVIVDAAGSSVRVGRSLRQTIRQREGSTAKGMNNESTPGQNNKAVISGLRHEVRENGPLRSFVKCCKDEESARLAEGGLYDSFHGRLDRRRC